jgi:uncharacterized protein
MRSPGEIADAFAANIGTYEFDRIRELCSPDAAWWINISGQEQTIDEISRTVALEREVVKEITITEVGRLIADDGFALRLRVEATTVGGADVSVALVYLGTVRDGLITRIDEYTDSAAVRPLLKEIFAPKS